MSLLGSFHAYAKEVKDIHYTTLLPMISNLKPADEKELEALITDKLIDHKVFHFKTHEGFYKLLRKKAPNLKTALHSPDVLKTVSEKLSVGSMIRLEVFEYLLGYEVTLNILSREGLPLYSRKKKVHQKTMNLLSSVINFWIEGYINESPYDATIVEVQKDTVLVDYPGENTEIFPNMQFVVVRHLINPVDDDSEKPERFEEIAYGIITDINKEFFMGKILELRTESKILPSDYIKFKIFDEEIAARNPDYKYRKHDLGDYRDRGKVTMLGSVTKIQGDGNSANFVGATGNLDLFLPSNSLLLFEFSRKISSSSTKSQINSRGSGSSLKDSSYKALVGYTFVPPKFKYISYIDLYAGWSQDQNYLSGLGILGVGDVYFEGPVVGVRLEHPFYSNLSALSSVEYSVQPSYEEHERKLGDGKDTSAYLIQLGMRYRFHRSGLCVEGLVRRKNQKASFKKNDVILNIDSNQILFGISNFF